MLREFKLFTCLAVAATPWLLAVPGTASADEVFKATSVVNLGHVLSSFDIGFVNSVKGIYLLAERSIAGVDIITTNNNSPGQLAAGTFQGVKSSATSGPNGVITANNHAEVWAGDGNSTLKVVQLSNATAIYKNIPTGTWSNAAGTGGTFTQGKQRADELCEDASDHLVAIANDEPTDLFVDLVDTTTYAVVKSLRFNGTDPNAKNLNATGGIEQCKWSPRTGKIYVNLPEINGSGQGAVVVIDPKTMNVATYYEIPAANCTGPTGMAIGPSNQILIGCSVPASSPSSAISAIINENDGSVIATLPHVGSDEAWFAGSHYFLANSGGTQLDTVDAGTKTEDQSVTTATGSHSVAADPDKVYVPIKCANTGGTGGCNAYSATSTPPTTACSQVGGVDGNGCILVLRRGPANK